MSNSVALFMMGGTQSYIKEAGDLTSLAKVGSRIRGWRSGLLWQSSFHSGLSRFLDTA